MTQIAQMDSPVRRAMPYAERRKAVGLGLSAFFLPAFTSASLIIFGVQKYGNITKYHNAPSRRPGRLRPEARGKRWRDSEAGAVPT